MVGGEGITSGGKEGLGKEGKGKRENWERWAMMGKGRRNSALVVGGIDAPDHMLRTKQRSLVETEHQNSTRMGLMS